jgi:hypothetical protein
MTDIAGRRLRRRPRHRRVGCRAVRPLAAILALVSSLALAACGAAGSSSKTDFKGTQGEVASVVEDLQTAAGDDNAPEICSNLLAPALLAALRSRSVDCVDAVDSALDAVDSTELEALAVTVSGTTATARVRSGSDGDGASTHTMRFVREGRNWKITAL